jgi:chemotaxis protein MotA
MDLGTLIGLIITVILVLIAIGTNIIYFIDIPSVMIVVGCTIGVTLVKYRLNEIINSFKIAVMAAFFDKTESPQELIELATSLTKIVQKEGVIALEGQEIKNPYFSKGIDLVMDGHSPEFTEKVLRNEMSKKIEESEVGVNLLTGMGDAAPAMGMIGTLIGLVIMLQNMSDPGAIGPGMAIALITTLYGAVIAQIFCIPLAEKLKLRNKDTKDMLELIIQSVLSIQQGQSAIIMNQLLETYVKRAAPTEKKQA